MVAVMSPLALKFNFNSSKEYRSRKEVVILSGRQDRDVTETVTSHGPERWTGFFQMKNHQNRSREPRELGHETSSREGRVWTRVTGKTGWKR